MTEIRCKKCNRLLMKADVVIIDIKCPKCGYEQGFRKVDLSEMLKYKSDHLEFEGLQDVQVSNYPGIRPEDQERKAIKVTVSLI